MERDQVHRPRRLFIAETQPGQGGPWQPLVDVYHTRGGWLIKFDLAGVRPEDITLTIQGRRLLVRGCRHDSCLTETCGQYLMEIAYSHFERSVTLPEEVESFQLVTEYRDGMLLVRLHKDNQR